MLKVLVVLEPTTERRFATVWMEFNLLLPNQEICSTYGAHTHMFQKMIIFSKLGKAPPFEKYHQFSTSSNFISLSLESI